MESSSKAKPKFDKSYLDTAVDKTSVSNILINAIKFPKLLQSIELSDEIKRSVLYSVVDDDYTKLESALTDSSQHKIIEFINATTNDISTLPSALAKLNTTITVSSNNLKILINSLILDHGFVSCIYSKDVISDIQRDILDNTSIPNYKRVNVLFTQFLSNMTSEQCDGIKYGMTETGQSDLIQYLPKFE